MGTASEWIRCLPEDDILRILAWITFLPLTDVLIKGYNDVNMATIRL
jgi:hypothetical protein